MGSFAIQFSRWLDIPSAYQEHISEGLQHIPLPSDLSDTNWHDLILYLVPSWHQSGTMLKRLDWPKRSIFTSDDMKEVPGWDQTGTKLLHKKAAYLIRIMFLATKAISLEEVMKANEYKNRASFRKNYLDALESTGIVTKTIPDVPRSPDQKYILTESGKLFLGGYSDPVTGDNTAGLSGTPQS